MVVLGVTRPASQQLCPDLGPDFVSGVGDAVPQTGQSVFKEILVWSERPGGY